MLSKKNISRSDQNLLASYKVNFIIYSMHLSKHIQVCILYIRKSVYKSSLAFGRTSAGIMCYFWEDLHKMAKYVNFFAVKTHLFQVKSILEAYKRRIWEKFVFSPELSVIFIGFLMIIRGQLGVGNVICALTSF